jgi:hypothetical protein
MYFEIILKDSDSDFFDVNRIYIGKYFETKINMSYGMKNGRVDNTEQTRTRGGSLWSDSSITYRKISFDLSNLDESERVKAMTAFYKVGKSEDFFLSCFPEIGGVKERDYSFAGKFTSDVDFTNNLFNNFTTNFEISEV